MMELLPNEEKNMVVDDYVFEKIKKFQYLGLTITNNWSIEVMNCMRKAERAYFALHKYFKSKVSSRGTRVRLYMPIIRPTVTYGCEVWPTTQQLEKSN